MISRTPYQFERKELRIALYVLVVAHLFIIAASNILVQFPFRLGPMHTTWGAISFPFLFLLTDLTVRIFGAPLARRIVFVAMIPALVISYLLSIVFIDHQSMEDRASHIFTLRIVFASFFAYVLGQLMDITVFAKLRQSPRWWLAPSASTIVGNLIDTLAFFTIAFYQSPDPYMAAHWPELAAWDYFWKILIGNSLFVPAYGVALQSLQKTLLRGYQAPSHRPAPR